MRRGFLVILLSALLGSVSCNSKPVIPTTSRLSPMTSPLLASMLGPTAAPTLKATSTPTPWTTSTATPSPTLVPTPVGIAPPPGLIFATYGEYGLWQIDENGVPRKILDQLPVSVSAEGSHVVYNDHDVFWMHDLDTGKSFNLTEVVGRRACCFQWFSARPADVFFNSSLPEKQIPPFTAGFPMTFHLSTGVQRVLDDSHVSFTAPALSPDGQTIAYDRSGKGWLLRLDDAAHEIDPVAYGLSKVETMVNPVWSPWGRRLVWAVFSGGKWGYGVFNLKEQTAQLLHQHNSTVFEGWPERAVWSPDGRWLALNIYSQALDDDGIWIVSVDDEMEHRLGNDHSKMIWSPDSRGLAAGRTLYEVGTWRAQPLDLPQDAEVVAWVSPTK